MGCRFDNNGWCYTRGCGGNDTSGGYWETLRKEQTSVRWLRWYSWRDPHLLFIPERTQIESVDTWTFFNVITTSTLLHEAIVSWKIWISFLRSHALETKRDRSNSASYVSVRMAPHGTKHHRSCNDTCTFTQAWVSWEIWFSFVGKQNDRIHTKIK